MASQPKEIDWNDFNYPPCIRLFHFRVSEVPQEHRATVMVLLACHLLLLVISLLDLVSNIVQAAMNLGKIRVLYSFLFILIFNPLQTFIFHRGYEGLCREYSKLKLYKIMQPIVIILWVVFSIVAFLGFNGYIRAANLFGVKAPAPAVLCIIESILLDIVAALSCFSLLKAFRHKPTDQIDRLKQAIDFTPTGLITKLF
jgi:hypothetical protein